MGEEVIRLDAPAYDIHAANWLHCEAHVPEDGPLLSARDRALAAGCVPISSGAGALLAMLAASLRATSVVEVAACSPVSSLWLLRGMAPDGVLTTIEVDTAHQHSSRTAFAEIGLRATRTRTIPAPAEEALPRLTDGGYDLVLIGADRRAHPEYIDRGLELLRPGGVLVLDGALDRGQVPNPVARNPTTAALRDASRRLLDDERVVPALVPCGDGLLIAARR